MLSSNRQLVVIVKPRLSKDWEPKEAREAIDAIQKTLTVDIDCGKGGKVDLVIGIDDTFHPEHDGGPCNGFVPAVRIHHLGRLVANQWPRSIDHMYDEDGEPGDIQQANEIIGFHIEAAVWLEQQAMELRMRAANLRAECVNKQENTHAHN